MGQRIDPEKLRVGFRQMSRGNLLCVAERAIELVPRARLGALVAGMVRPDQLAEGKRGASSLLEEVRTFYDACLRRDYYDSFDVNSKNYMDTAKGSRRGCLSSRPSASERSRRPPRLSSPRRACARRRGSLESLLATHALIRA